MITDPRFAPRRNDLGFLRRRHRPKAARAAAPAAAPREPARPTGPANRVAASTSGAPPDAKVAEYFSGHRPGRESSRPAAPPTPPAPPRRATPAPAAASSLDLDAPAASPVLPPPPTPPPPRPSSSLDLDAPAAPAAPAPPPAVSSSLDLDSPAPAPATTPAARPSGAPSTSLDLDSAAAPAARSAAPPATPAAARVRSLPVARMTPGGRTILSRKSPTVTLTRTQTGIGALSIEAASSAEVGDLRLGAAYQLRSGQSSTLQLTGGNRLAPPRSRRPVLVAAHDRYERISVDLRQSPDIERLAVYAFSESRAQLKWGGTLIVTTFAGAKIEIPLEELPPGEVAVLMSLYNVGGEFVLRAEIQTITGSIREAARAYGYDQISWLDDRTPIE